MGEGFVSFKSVDGRPQMDDLWFMTGSRCNLSCSHCYVSSSPTNDTLEQLSFQEVKTLVEEGLNHGLKHVYFTGGEPFINKDIMKILSFCLKRANVTVLTNATYSLKRCIKELSDLKDGSEYQLKLRISFDHFIEEKHDEIRGKGSFALTLKNTKELIRRGFIPIITCSAVVFEGSDITEKEVVDGFLNLFEGRVEVKILPFNLEMGSNLQRITKLTKTAKITEECMKVPGVVEENFQCHNGRTIQKIGGKLRIYPCPIIYNEPDFEMGDDLRESFKRTYLNHKSCFDFCYKSGGKCTN